MYNPKTNYNTNSSFNKYKGTYFNNSVDISGGDIILRTNGSNLYMSSNSNIYSSNNRIEFNDISNNIYFHTPLKMYYNSIEYDIGQKLGQIQDLYNKIGPMNFLNNSNIFYNNIDISSGNINIRNGNLYLSPDSSIFTSNNQIQFNEEFQFCDFLNNVNVIGQLKNTYNSIEYDVGLQCEKTDQIISTVSTLSPIVYDTAFKCTNFYYDQQSNSTVWSGLLTCSPASIASSSIANTTRFIEGTGVQNIGGVKTFLDAPVMSGGSINVGSIPINRISGTAVNTNGAQNIVATKTFTVSQTFQNNIRLDASLVLSNGGLTLVNSTLQRVAYLADVNSAIGANLTSLQSQINNFSGISLSASNNFTGTTNSFNSISFTGTLNSITSAVYNKVQYLSNITSDIQDYLLSLSGKMSGFYRSETGTYWFDSNLNTNGKFNTLTPYEIGNLTGTTEPLQIAIDALKTKTDTTNINLATTTTNANDALQRTQEISFSDTPFPQTNITSKCVTEELVFTTDLNDVTPTTFSYLQGVTSSIQTQLNSKTDTIPGTIIQHISANLQTNFPTRFLLCNGQSVSRTTYANLFSYIGTTYGSVDGNSFNVPDFSACFLRMASSARTVNGVVYTPNAVGSIQQDSLEAHVHSSNLTGTYLNSSSQNGVNFTAGLSTFQRPSFPSFTGGVSSSHRTSTETRPLNHSVYFYVTC